MHRTNHYKAKRNGILGITAALVAIAVGFWAFGKRGVAFLEKTEIGLPHGKAPDMAHSGPVANVRSRFDALIQHLRATADPKFGRDQLSELRSVLQSLTPDSASAAVREWLDSRVDAPTHLPFKVGPDGFLQASPSVRVFLLDYLGQVDRVGAAAYAEKILAATDSPDEWAVALRNYASGNATPDGRSFLDQKLQTMLTHQPWVREPSDGFLEAFDVAVYASGTNLIPTLTGLVRMNDNQAVAHAAYLALDRLTISDAPATLSMLQANPGLMAGREETRANFFARADVREPAQRQLLEEYLLDPARNASELDKFAGLYPNANYMISHNLLTPAVAPDGTWLAGRDAEALRVLQQWIGDMRFERLKPQFETIQRRLAKFAQQASRRP